MTGATTTSYAFTASGAPLAEKTGSTTSFHLRDPHGDVIGLASTTLKAWRLAEDLMLRKSHVR